MNFDLTDEQKRSNRSAASSRATKSLRRPSGNDREERFPYELVKKNGRARPDGLAFPP